MEFKKQKINGRMLNVVSYENFQKNKDVNSTTQTAVEVKLQNEEYVLPVRNSSDDRPGVYIDGSLHFFVPPTPEEKDEYSKEHLIDLANSKDIKELIEKQKMLRSEEEEILCSPDNIFVPPLKNTDSPLMRGLKEATIAKHIDIDKYADKIGREDFANTKRKFKDDDITLFMTNRITKALDMKMTVIIEDANPDVPNPIGKQIVIDLSKGADD